MMTIATTLRTVRATRYVTPLREGGSLPAIVEADDDGLYVLKFRGAGQGPKALIAELIGGELARALGLRVPELVFVELDAVLGRSEPDYEIQQLIQSSAGLNLALDYLPGSITYDPLAAPPVAAEVASSIVWLDAYLTNVDRTARNTNLLLWHRQLWLIDHGAALYIHHTWDRYLERALAPFPRIKDHVLLPFASAMREVHEGLCSRITPHLVNGILSLIPDDWLRPLPALHAPDPANREPPSGPPPRQSALHTEGVGGVIDNFGGPVEQRAAYLAYLSMRMTMPRPFWRRPCVPAHSSFDYAIIRVVPRVERGEYINAGIILFCRTRRFLAARVELDPSRLAALFSDVDHQIVQRHLDTFPLICAGGPGAGPLGSLGLAERFHWLVAPRSTIIQLSPVHCGVCDDPSDALQDLFSRLVKPSITVPAAEDTVPGVLE